MIRLGGIRQTTAPAALQSQAGERASACDFPRLQRFGVTVPQRPTWPQKPSAKYDACSRPPAPGTYFKGRRGGEQAPQPIHSVPP